MNLFPFVLFSFAEDRTSQDLLLNLALKRQSKTERQKRVRRDGNMRNVDEDENTERERERERNAN